MKELLYNGEVRTMMATEVGIAPSPGLQEQKAALVASYKYACANGDVILMNYCNTGEFNFSPEL